MGTNTKSIRIGTRASELALAQAEMTMQALLIANPSLEPEQIEIVPMTTSGDQNKQDAVAQWGYKGLFTKEIEEALLEGSIDIAVHSMKDMPSELPKGLKIHAMLPRADVRDAFISLKHPSLADMPEGAVLGTSSVRRGAQIKRLRPDLKIIEYRGSVNTRLRKLEEEQADATLLAVAGLTRIGLEKHITEMIEPDAMLPAVAQGAIGIEAREDDADTLALLEEIDHADTSLCVHCEREVLRLVDGTCKTPVAAHAQLFGERIQLRAMVLAADGSEAVEFDDSDDVDNASALGQSAGEYLLEHGGHLLREV
ncbi:MAG: hydroxymethylbilane synthase [Rickettsiales bacterium]|nr:hydroxymethylbilane synthase [Rickettsiales bacterium]